MAADTLDPKTRRNLVIHVFEVATYYAGAELASIATVMPILLDGLGASRLVVGLAGGVAYIGLVSQVLAVPAIERRRGRKRMLVILGVFMRAPFALMGLSVLLLATASPKVCIGALLACMLISSLALGVTIPAWFDLISRTIPSSRVPSLFGYRHAIAGAFIVGLAWIGTRVLGHFGFPNGFAVLLLMGFVLTAVSWVLFTQIADVQRVRVRPRPRAFRHHMHELWRMLRTYAPFRKLLLARGLYLSARASELFFALCCVERFRLGDDAAGWFLMVIAAARSLSALIFSRMTDRIGCRATAALAGLLCAAACALAAWAPSSRVYFLVFVLQGTYFSMGQITGGTLTMQLAPKEGRVGFVSLLMLAILPITLIAQIGGGAVVDRFAFAPLFIGAGIAAVASSIAFVALPASGGGATEVEG